MQTKLTEYVQHSALHKPTDREVVCIEDCGHQRNQPSFLLDHKPSHEQHQLF